MALPPRVSALSQASFPHHHQSNMLSCSHLGIGLEQLPAVTEGKSQGVALHGPPWPGQIP